MLEGVVYNLAHQKFENEKWMPLDPPGPATVQYAGYAEAVSEKHFRKMLKFKSEESGSKDKKRKK